MSIKTKAIIFLTLIELMGLGFVFGGGYILYWQRHGEPTTATVTSCVRRNRADVCEGNWMAGGQFHSGTIEDADRSDLDQKIQVVAWGERAVKPGLRLPIVLFCVGIGFCGLGVLWWFKEGPGKGPVPNRAA